MQILVSTLRCRAFLPFYSLSLSTCDTSRSTRKKIHLLIQCSGLRCYSDTTNCVPSLSAFNFSKQPQRVGSMFYLLEKGVNNFVTTKRHTSDHPIPRFPISPSNTHLRLRREHVVSIAVPHTHLASHTDVHISVHILRTRGSHRLKRPCSHEPCCRLKHTSVCGILIWCGPRCCEPINEQLPPCVVKLWLKLGCACVRSVSRV